MSTIKVDTVRPVTTDGSLTLQGDLSGSGVTGAKVFGDGSLGADSITDLAGTGAPDFPNGLILASNAITGNITGVTLDDYEEGTWTPQFVNSSGSNNCAVASVLNGAYYTKIGNLVTCSFRWNASGGAAVDAYLRGMPFSPSTTSGKSANVVILASDSEGITYWRNDGSNAFTLVGKQLSGLSSIFRAQFSYFTD